MNCEREVVVQMRGFLHHILTSGHITYTRTDSCLFDEIECLLDTSERKDIRDGADGNNLVRVDLAASTHQ